jgi:hypothetical protein
LLEAVFHDRIEALCARARDLLGHPDPEAALTGWLRAFVTHAATQRGLAAALVTPASEPPRSGGDCRTMIRAAGEELLVQAQRAGAVRPDIAIADLLELVNAIALITERESDGADHADRLLAIVITGMRNADPRTHDPSDTTGR